MRTVLVWMAAALAVTLLNGCPEAGGDEERAGSGGSGGAGGASTRSACANWIAECPEAPQQFGMETASDCTEIFACVRSLYDDDATCRGRLEAILDCVGKIDAADCSACDDELDAIVSGCPYPEECFSGGAGGTAGEQATCGAPGTEVACACEGGEMGVQVCQADGTYTACVCTGGTGGTGGPGPVCGDGIINGNEFCDGDNLAGENCASLGEGTGTLACDAVTCTFDISMCRP